MGGDITGEIHLLTDTTDGCPPWNDASTLSNRIDSNFALPTTRLTLHDLRGKEKSVNIDINGFELAKYEGSINNEFDEGSEEQRIFYEEITSFFKKRLGASRVIIFNYIFRYRGSPRPDDQCDMKHKNIALKPHVDMNSQTARLKIETLLGKEESKQMINKRFQIINIWRPLGPNPITNKPLAVCDYSTLDVNNDVHPLTVRGLENSSTSYTISCKIPDSQKWYYLSEMRSDEMLVMKTFDTKPDVAQYCFHAAFINEHVPPSNVEQKSIDMRCLIVYD